MNSVVHFEIPFVDKQRAQKFYTSLFGWTVQEIPEMDYSMVQTTEGDAQGRPKNPGAINGGLFQRTPEAQAPVLVIDVPSIDAHLKKIGAAGGKVAMPKTSIGDMDFYARVTDTEGNVIGLWENVKK